MTDETIEAGYLWTEEEFLTASEVRHRRSPSQIPRYGRPFFIVVLGLYGGILCFAPSPAPVIGTFVLILAGGLFYLGTATYRRRALSRAFRKAGDMVEPDQKVTFVADGHRLRTISAGTDSSVIWELVSRVIEDPQGFLIYTPGLARWLPNHAFRDEDDRERFARFARAAKRFDSYLAGSARR